MAPSKFRAIIIGGGPVGLAIANGLDRAGLDYLVVERHPTIISESGAGIMLWPHTVRIFDQLGLIEACKDRFIPLYKKTNLRLDGTPTRTAPIFEYLDENHGYAVMNFPRPGLVQTLLDGLGANQSKIRTGAGIEDIEMTESGVRVRLSNGSIEEGSIVIGADGVHSRTRAIMRKLAKAAGQDFDKDEEPIMSSYQIMYGRASYVPGVEVGTFFETHGTYRSSQFSASKDRMHFGIYRKLPSPTTDTKKEYSEEEVAEFVKAFADVSVAPNLTFKELYANCEWTKLVNQHEGLTKHWYFGRVALAGDSCAQMTAAAGMGVNNGLQSAIALVNKLHEVLGENSDPSTDTLEQAFEEYQNVRREESRAICGMAAQVIRINTWDSWIGWLMGEIIVPMLVGDEKLITKLGTNLVSKMRKLDFIQRDLKSGKIPWVQT
ncbi:FAD/NAD(P)-binding domain-containing protein [Xylariaceae sp. FL1651]|nr:FAD/NAD(P)-binding domain-containing protein [Xylariaceae sp. FL1651]